MKKEALTSKSIRLEERFVEFIENQPGKNFTVKLSGILDEYIRGEEKRKEDIKYYDQMILRRRKELQQYTGLEMLLAKVRTNAMRIEHMFSEIMEGLEKDDKAEKDM